MQLKSIVTFSLWLVTLTTALPTRQSIQPLSQQRSALDSAGNAILASQTALDSLLTTIIQFNGTPDQLRRIDEAGGRLWNAMNNGANQISSSEPMNMIEAATLLRPVFQLDNNFDRVVQAFNFQSRKIINTQGAGMVVSSLTQEREAASRMLTAMFEKIPPQAQVQILPFTGRIPRTLDFAIQQWKQFSPKH